MMKPPQGSCPPYLALGFFGVTHTHNMSRILATPELFQYVRKFHTEGDDLERCITISENIPLARDLEVHAAMIHKQNVAVRRHRNYMNIISREEATRRQNNG